MTPSGQTLTNDQLVLELEGKLQCSICLATYDFKKLLDKFQI